MNVSAALIHCACRARLRATRAAMRIEIDVVVDAGGLKHGGRVPNLASELLSEFFHEGGRRLVDIVIGVSSTMVINPEHDVVGTHSGGHVACRL